MKKTIEPLFIRKMTEQELNELRLILFDLRVNGLFSDNKYIPSNKNS